MYTHRIKAAIMFEINAVIKAYNATDRPIDTVQMLVDQYGEKDAERLVATLVNAVSLHDGRIYEPNREWAQNIKSAPTNEELHEIGIYGVDSLIHSYHVDVIAQRMRKYKEV